MVDPIVSYLGVESGDPIGHKRFLALFSGGMLPIISLSFLHMLVKFEEEEKIEVNNTNVNVDELSIEAGKKEAEIEKENENKKFTPTQEQLEMIEKILTDKSEKQQIENISQEELTEDPEIKRLSYTRRNV